MGRTVRKLNTQLKTWRDRIETLADQGLQPATAAESNSPPRIAELRALHATALREFTGFRLADAAQRVILKPQTVVAWNALAAAIRIRKPAI